MLSPDIEKGEHSLILNTLDQTNGPSFLRFSARDQEMMWVIASLLRNHLANRGRRQEFWGCQVSTCALESMKEYERHYNPWFLKRKWNLTSESLFNLCRQHESSSCFTVILWILFLHFPAHQVLHVLILLHQHLSLQRPETEQLQQLNGAVTEVDWHHQRETKSGSLHSFLPNISKEPTFHGQISRCCFSHTRCCTLS